MRSLGYPRDYAENSPSIAQLFDLSGRVALITGGASGVGRAIGLGFARFGADVAVVDLDAERAASVANEIRALGKRAEPVSADVTDWGQVQAMAARVEELFGRIDICVNSAGSNIRKPILEMSPEEWRFVLDLNLAGTWHTAKAVGATMVARGRGKMINLASIYGHVAIETASAYAASKGGVVQLTRVLAVEWAPHNVQVNCLAPTYLKTPLVNPILQDAERVSQLNERSPIHRFGEPWELIGPAVFLASDASGLVTGHSLLVDGGWTAI
jgi:NAD(P)-dependent dehydrogenase (short-subunit alcohol dehydrogenase family)